MPVSALPPERVGAVLCGGASRRMGADKATLPLAGVAMAVRVAQALAAVPVDEVLAIGGGPSVRAALADHEVRHVADRRPGQGPLAAIATALAAAAGRPVMVVGCDLINPDPVAFATCLEALASSGAEVAVPVTGERLQWDHAAWSPAALSALETALAGGERAIHRATASLRIHRVEGVTPASLADADTPGDLPGGTLAPEPRAR